MPQAAASSCPERSRRGRAVSAALARARSRRAREEEDADLIVVGSDRRPGTTARTECLACDCCAERRVRWRSRPRTARPRSAASGSLTTAPRGRAGARGGRRVAQRLGPPSRSTSRCCRVHRGPAARSWHTARRARCSTPRRTARRRASIPRPWSSRGYASHALPERAAGVIDLLVSDPGARDRSGTRCWAAPHAPRPSSSTAPCWSRRGAQPRAPRAALTRDG